MNYDVIIVGGGMAGLTSAAYLSKAGYKVLLCEKEKKVGGLVNSFNYKGFTFDGGIRAIENSGIVLPMLRQLGLEIDFVKNIVSIGVENDVIRIESNYSLKDYQTLLSNKFPDNVDDIGKIINEIKRIMKYMDILYGIDNPLFLDLKSDKEYLFKTILPWLIKYLATIKKINKLNEPVDEYLQNFTKNQALIDLIAQHFFKKTPTFFALSYFSLYLDYKYPKSGTGAIPEKMEEFIVDNKGEIKKETEICSVNPEIKQVKDSKGNEYNYKRLIWASDLKRLYNSIDLNSLSSEGIVQKVMERKSLLSDKKGGDSILTLYLTVDMDKSCFEGICTEHFFYTPFKKGLMSLNTEEITVKASDNGDLGYTLDKEAIIKWIKNYYDLTTYEIACPVMRDVSLAPEGKTGLIISTLIEYSLVKHISEMGWYDEFKKITEECIKNILDATIFKGMKSKVMDQFTSTPLTLEKMTGNSDGAITGWAFTNNFMPVENRLPRVTKSIFTGLPDVLQAGQWSFSPSGLPIAILTGKLAADEVEKQLK
ncbi:MAG: phytoene desaturase family protein [Clostridiaceae bacterium]